MEYTSPLGYNFKLSESLSGRNDKRNGSEEKSLPSPILLDSEKSFKVFSNESMRNRNFESPRTGLDQKCRRNWPRDRRQREHSILDFYHPSMLENPWKELEEAAEIKQQQ